MPASNARDACSRNRKSMPKAGRALVAEPAGKCRTPIKYLSQQGVRAASASTSPSAAAITAQAIAGGAGSGTAASGPTTRLRSPKKRSRQRHNLNRLHRRRQQVQQHPPQLLATVVTCLWPRKDSGEGRRGRDDGGGGRNGGSTGWEMCNKENIDPTTGLPSQHPFTPFHPFSASSLLRGSPVKNAAAAASITTTTANRPGKGAGASSGCSSAGSRCGAANSVRRRLFCVNSSGDGGGQALGPIPCEPFREPLRSLFC